MASTSSRLTFDTWWDVIPCRTEGVTPLINRCIRILGWTEAFAQKVLLAYKDFIESKMFCGDYDAIKLSSSIPVDQIWHQHVLDKRNYTRDCKILTGVMLHYNPASDLDQEARAKQIQFTTNVIRLLTGNEELDPEIWNFGSVDQKSERNKNGKRKSSRNSKEAKRTKRSRAEECDTNEDEKKEEPHPPSTRPASRAARNAIRIAMMSDLEPITFLRRKWPKEAKRTKWSRLEECDNNVEEQKGERRPPSTCAASRAARSAI